MIFLVLKFQMNHLGLFVCNLMRVSKCGLNICVSVHWVVQEALCECVCVCVCVRVCVRDHIFD